MKLGRKLRLSYVGIVLVALSIVLILTVENSNRELTEKLGNDLRNVAKIESANIGDYVTSRINAMLFLSKNQGLKSANPKTIADYLKRIKESDLKNDNFTVIQPDGKIIASTIPEIEGNFIDNVRPGVAEIFEKAKAAEKGRVFFAYAFRDKEQKHMEGLFCSSLGEAGILMGSVDMDFIFLGPGMFDNVTLKGKKALIMDTTSVMIITQDGKEQSFHPMVYVQYESGLRGEERTEPNGFFMYKDEKGVYTFDGYAGLSGYGGVATEGWTVISMAPQKALFSPAIRLRNRMILLALVAIFIAWVLGFFLAKGITSPIRSLVKVTDMIAKGDLTQRAEIENDDEVGELASHFNKMTDKLDVSIATRDQEIIQRRNIEEKLHEEMEDKAKFISMISNEFKTSLTVIREGLGMVIEDASKTLNERDMGLVRLAVNSGKNMTNLVKDIVGYHRLETETEAFNFTDNSINGVVDDVHKGMLPLLAERRKEIILITDKDETLPYVKIDREKINLVLTNMLNIAINNCLGNGTVTVSTRWEGDNAVVVSIKDTGCSICQDDLNMLFEKFYKRGGDQDKKAGGSGLGLMISKKIVERHGGRIWAESAGKNGMILTFVLPISERRASSLE